MLTYAKVKDKPVVFRSFTSLEVAEFEQLLPAFSQAWQRYVEQEFVEGKERQRQPGGGRKPTLATMEDKLLFILFYLKTYPLQEVIAFLFGMSQGQANVWIHRLAQVLQMALGIEGHLPERDGAQLAEALAEYDILEFAIDGAERRRQRPKDKKEQKKYYSGKKKAHTVKNNVVVHTESRKVLYLSKTVEGKKHDKKLADEEGLTFPPWSVLFQDTGFQGFAPDKVIVSQPKKKPRGKELTMGEKMMNRVISSARIVVENVIAGIKRCRAAKDIFRNTKRKFDDLVMEIACGLHNFRVESRSPQQQFTLTDFYFQ
jgi:hypothetical protein